MRSHPLGFTENGWAVRRSFIVEAANGKGDHDRGTAIHRGHHGFGGDKAGLSRPLGAPFAY